MTNKIQCRNCNGDLTQVQMTDHILKSKDVIDNALPDEDEKFRNLIAVMMAPVLAGPHGIFECNQCGSKEGGCSAIVRSLFHVEPLPEPIGLVCYFDAKYGKKK